MKNHPPLKLIIPIFIAAISGYLATLNPALYRNDSPETITGCVTLGVTHPPGYPLFNLIGKCFSVFAVGNPAFTYNFMASLLASIGVCLFCLNLWVLLSHIESLDPRKNAIPKLKMIACLTASLLFAFSDGYWGNAIAPKGGVYVFQTILELTFLLFFQTALFKEKTNPFEFYFLFFIFLAGMINHWPSQFLFIPALFLLAVLRFQSSPRQKPLTLFKTVAVCVTFSLIMLSAYLYLPLRAHLYPILNFNAPYTWDRFIHSVLRSDYAKIETMASYRDTFLAKSSQKSAYISRHIFGEFYFLAYVFAVIGLFQLNKVNKKLTLFFVTFFLTTLLANLFYLQVEPIEFWHMDDHLLSSNWLLGIFIGVGIFAFFNALTTFSPNFRKALRAALMVLVLLLIPLNFFQNFSLNNQKNEFLYYGYGLTALKSMPKDTLYFAESDYDYFSTLYLKTVLNKRPDTHLLLTLFLDKPYERELILKTDPSLLASVGDKTSASVLFDLIQKNSPSRPIYSTFSNVGFSEVYLKNFRNMGFAPSGILTRIIQPGERTPAKPLYEPLRNFWDEYLEPEVENPSPIQGILRQACASPYLNAAQYEKLQRHMDHWDWYYSKAVNLIPESTWLAQTWFDRAEGDVLLGEYSEAQKSYRMAAYYFLRLGDTEKTKASLEKSKTGLFINPKSKL
jgi:hypothetical protein